MTEALIYRQNVDLNNRISLPAKAIELIDSSIIVEYDKKYLEFLIKEPIQLAIIRDCPFYFYDDFEDRFPKATMSWSICTIDYYNQIYEVCDFWGAPFPHGADGLTHRLSSRIFCDEDRFVKKRQRVTLNAPKIPETREVLNYEGFPALIICEKNISDVIIFKKNKDRNDAYQLAKKRYNNKG